MRKRGVATYPLALSRSKIKNVLRIEADWSQEKRIGSLAVENRVYEVVCFHGLVLDHVGGYFEAGVARCLVGAAMFEVPSVFLEERGAVAGES